MDITNEFKQSLLIIFFNISNYIKAHHLPGKTNPEWPIPGHILVKLLVFCE